MFQYAALHAIQKNIFMLVKNIPVAKDQSNIMDLWQTINIANSHIHMSKKFKGGKALKN